MRLLILTLWLLSPLSARAETGRIVEVRSYTLKPGTRDRFQQRFTTSRCRC